MALASQVVHDSFDRVRIEAAINHFLVLRDGVHEVLTVHVAQAVRHVLVHPIEFTEGGIFSHVKVADLVLTELGLRVLHEQALILHVSIRDHIRLALHRINVLFVVELDATPTTQLIGEARVVHSLLLVARMELFVAGSHLDNRVNALLIESGLRERHGVRVHGTDPVSDLFDVLGRLINQLVSKTETDGVFARERRASQQQVRAHLTL